MLVEQLKYPIRLQPNLVLKKYVEGTTSVRYMYKDEKYMMYLVQAYTNVIVLITGKAEEVENVFNKLVGVLLGLITDEEFVKMFPNLRVGD